MKFTVFTPTFNRKELLEKLYKSLQKQTYTDFEWLIVDDGSIDGTGEKVKEFLEESKLDIKYFYKENGGKQRAYNFATDGFETILKYWEKYEKDANIAGMGYLSMYPDGEIIGSSFPEKEMISTQFDIYNKYGVKGDKGLMFRTEIIKKYKFPVFDDEKFITEAVVYNRICEKYKMVYVNEKIEIKEYQEDGLTAKYNNLLLRNPKGQALYHNEINSQNLSFKQKVLNNAVYYKFCRAAGYKFGKIFKENKNKLFLIFALGIGEYMWQKEKNKK